MSRTKALEKVKLTRFDDLFGGKAVSYTHLEEIADGTGLPLEEVKALEEEIMHLV